MRPDLHTLDECAVKLVDPVRVALVGAAMPAQGAVVELADVFSVLGDPGRLLLRAHRVVSVSRRGRMAFYRLDDAHMRTLLELGLAHTGHARATHPQRSGSHR
jgi:hypothetical protein